MACISGHLFVHKLFSWPYLIQFVVYLVKAIYHNTRPTILAWPTLEQDSSIVYAMLIKFGRSVYLVKL